MDTSQINLRVLAACLPFVSKDPARYYLNGVLIEIDAAGTTYVAADGHRLIAYRDKIGQTTDKPPEPNRCVGQFIIPVPQCKAFKIGKDDDGIAKIFGGPRLTIAYGYVDITFAPIDGVYPNWRRVIPLRPASGTLAQFNLKLLANFEKFADQLILSKPFVAPNGEGLALVWFPGTENCLGCVMPYRMTEELGRVAPDWALDDGNHEQMDIEDPSVIRMGARS